MAPKKENGAVHSRLHRLYKNQQLIRSNLATVSYRSSRFITHGDDGRSMASWSSFLLRACFLPFLIKAEIRVSLKQRRRQPMELGGSSIQEFFICNG